MINFLKYRKIYYTFSGILVGISLISILFFGLNLGIEFTGGTLLEVNFENRPQNQVVQDKLKEFNLGEIILQPTQEQGLILRLKDIDEETHQKIITKLNEISPVSERRFETIGPVIGKELTKKAQIAIFLSIIVIGFYIIFAFRRVFRPISSWQYAISATIALFHDVLITVGIFAILGKYYNVEITVPILVALLTIFGYSINDTIVVFDRIRENLLRRTEINFKETVNKALNQTLSRSVYTSLTTLFVLLAVFFFGGETLRYFSLSLIFGILIGTYSSIFLASPLLVSLAFRNLKKIPNK